MQNDKWIHTSISFAGLAVLAHAGKIMFGEPLKHLGETASTNDDARVWAQSGAPHGAVVRADSQTRGRGRLGRNWVSPAGLGLYVSLILRPQNALSRASQLTFVAALACADAIETATGLRASMKWPNDIVLHGKKVGGILCEAFAASDAKPANEKVQNEAIEYLNGEMGAFVVVGIGLNLNFDATDLPHDAKLPASSLKIESGNWQNGDAVFQSLMFALQTRYEAWQNDGWDALRREFAARDVLQNQWVRVESASEVFRGRAAGIDADGVLLVQSENDVRRVVAGDVKLEEL